MFEQIAIDNFQMSIEKLNSAVQQYQQWFTLASKEIELLKKELEDLEKELNCSEVTMQLKDELANVKNKVRTPQLENVECCRVIALTYAIISVAAGYGATSNVAGVRYTLAG